MYEPDAQRIVIVAATDPSATWGLEEAAEINFDRSDEVPQADLLDRVLEPIRHLDFTFEEKRQQTDWGATGPYVQEILLVFSINTAAELTAAAIIATLRKLSRRSAQGLVTGDAVEVVSSAATAEEAWASFSRFLGRAFGVSSTMATDIHATEEGWLIRANGDGYRYEGVVSNDGRISRARKVG